MLACLLVASAFGLAECKAQSQDFANFKRYAADNRVLEEQGPVKGRVVFMGNSITEGWVRADAAFFERTDM